MNSQKGDKRTVTFLMICENVERIYKTIKQELWKPKKLITMIPWNSDDQFF